ncbi:MAG: DNA-binding protein WhiA [Oscillospiraceae bacterium]|nr:DNA-binding protein WhiA [Oscillospiraceae bacterium]
MSFSSDVKNELNNIPVTSKKARQALRQGMLYGSKNEKAGRLITPSGDNETGLFLRGVFLSCGTVSDPVKDYHLELNLPDENKREELFTLITENGIAIRKSAGKNRLYIKESELISDFLTYIGAGVNSMEIMNAKILKELRNNINRTVNCEAANIGKTARAAGKQIADIELIYKKKGKNFLPPELRQVADLRLNHFEKSLKEIGEECEPKLSRSGVFHRLEKIGNIAEKLKNENQKN